MKTTLAVFTTLLLAIGRLSGGEPDADSDAQGYVVASTRSRVWESTIAISPVNPRVAVAVGMQERTTPALSYVGQPFRTTDGGATWEYGGALGMVPPDEPSRAWARQGDPVITVDRKGVFYISTLLGFPATYPLTRSGIGVFRSTDGGATWEGPFVVTQGSRDDAAFKACDKEWIGTDNSGGLYDGNVYVSWLQAPPGTQEVEAMFGRSTDGGRTWSTPVVLGKGGGGQMVVDGDGVLHVLWPRQGGDLIDAISRDGGATFEPPVVAVARKSGSFPSVVADVSRGPHRNNLYVVWVAGTRPAGTQPPLSRGVAGAVLFVRSTDGGQTWSQPSMLTEPALGNVAAFASAAVDPATGHLIVAWQDRRDKPSSREFRLYATRSTDGGATFAPPRAITSAVSLDTEGFIGDYYGTAAQNGRAMSVFSDANGRTSIAPFAFEEPQPRGRRRAVRR